MARTTTIPFFTDDYADRLDTLLMALHEAEKHQEKGTDPTRTLLDGDPVAELEAEYKALKAEALEAARAAKKVVTLSAIGRKEWRSLREKHPPRSGEGVDPEVAKQDRDLGCDGDGIEDDLVYASTIEPEFSSRGAFDEWADALAEGEWKVLVIESWNYANGARAIPKDHLPSSRTASDG